jgi:predicted transcriptional regulator
LFGKNRDKLSIVAAILEVAVSGATKTRIMYTANLSFKLLEKYLDKIVNLGFLEAHDSCYIITEQGFSFLKQYRNYYEHYAKVKKLCEALEIEREKLVKLCERPNVAVSEATVEDAE